MTVYLDLVDYLLIAEGVTGIPADTLAKSAGIDLADSALHAPGAGFGDVEFYPDLYDKAAVLLVHLIANHPLPDGNKRAAWVATDLFLRLNGQTGISRYRDHEAFDLVVAIAGGMHDHEVVATALRYRA